MTRERFIEIMQDDEIKVRFPDGDSALCGLNLIAKYLPKKGVEAAEHDIIYSVDIDAICDAGITEQDAIQLREWNWMVDLDCDCLASFV